ncbi:MAG: MBL fold metallo-hydrolase [Deltaproteobacteria bacterium]|nr:MBL fold metallo-hydrolase [Deltaproteobacteria bacterium]
MKRHTIGILGQAAMALLIIGLGLSGNVLAAEKLTEIAANVYAYVDTRNMTAQNSFGANAGIIIGRDGILVVDTLVSSREAQRFIKDIRAISDKPIRYVVNTHHHLDHAFGNADFARQGAVIISQLKDAANLKMHGQAVLGNAAEYGLTPQDMEGTEIVLPSLAFGDRLDIDLGDRTVQLLYAGVSHTEGSILVYLPESRVLFAGDILFTGYHPFLGEGDIQEWVKVLDRIAAMDADKIIPGHGPLSTKKDVRDMKEYLLVFDKKARELASTAQDAGLMAAEMGKILPPKAEGEGLIKMSIEQKYLRKEAAPAK